MENVARGYRPWTPTSRFYYLDTKFQMDRHRVGEVKIAFIIAQKEIM